MAVRPVLGRSGMRPPARPWYSWCCPGDLRRDRATGSAELATPALQRSLLKGSSQGTALYHIGWAHWPLWSSLQSPTLLGLNGERGILE